MWNYEKKKGYLHFSVDDTIQIFRDLTEQKAHYQSIFENKILSFFKELHKQYGIVVSLYCYYTDGVFSLDQMTDQYQAEWKENSTWLRLGVHGFSCYTDLEENENGYFIMYSRVIKEFLRFTGTEQVIDRMPRMDYYQLPAAAFPLLKKANMGIIGLLGADKKEIKSYYLSMEESKNLYQNGKFMDSEDGIFLKTDLCLDDLPSGMRGRMILWKMLKIRKKHRPFLIFTHEWLWKNEKEDLLKNQLKWICELEQWRNYAFPMDIEWRN